MRAAMSVLTRDVIERELDEGRIRIEPFDRSQIGVASIDLTLGRDIRQIMNDPQAIRVEDSTDYRDHTRVLDLDEPFRLDPGVTIHGITAEQVSLPDDLCGFLEGRSRFARLGLMIHVTSAFVQPGVSNRQVLEMSNVSSRALEIVAGVRICQLVLMRTEGRAVYRGRFQHQRDI
jgi:dCTP deaminase